jgi:PAS domain S-box-containing protein
VWTKVRNLREFCRAVDVSTNFGLGALIARGRCRHQSMRVRAPSRAERSRAPAAASAATDVGALLDLLLRQSFVLTDPSGSVTSWGAHATALLGVDTAAAAGRPLLEVLGDSRREQRSELLGTEGRLQLNRIKLKASHAAHGRFACELSIVPIRLSDGYAFNAFVRELAADGPTEERAKRLRLRHPQVLEVLESTLSGKVELEEGERLAGAIVAFRALDPTPWLEGALDSAARPPKDADAEESATGTAADRLVQASRVLDQVEEWRGEARSALAEAASVRTELSAALERTEQLATRNQELHDQLAEVRSQAEEARLEIASAMAGDRVGGTAAADEVRAAADASLEALSQVREEVERVRIEAGELRSQVESARADAEAARAQAEHARADAEAARADLERSREEAARAHAAAERARALADEARRDLSQASERLMAALPDAPTAEAPPADAAAPTQPVARTARPGFDDAPVGMAVIGLDGRFRDLNPLFSALIGYSEDEFRGATFPSTVDRENRDTHVDLLRAMAAGESEGDPVETCYVASTGLLLPLSGRLSLVRDGEGHPDSLLLVLDEPTPQH